MRKILIFGNSGSGKSTLATSLRDSDRLSHLDLDTIAWSTAASSEGHVPERQSIEESNKAIQQFIALNNSWVIEGCYADLLELAMPFCNEVIFMNLPIDACIANAKNRLWESHKYASKEAQDANLPMLIDWISQYNERTDVFSEQAHRTLYDKFSGKKTMYVNNERSINLIGER